MEVINFDFFADIHHEDNVVSEKYSQMAADNVDISRSPIQIGYVKKNYSYFFLKNIGKFLNN